MYQAIETKYLGPTDTRGSRIKAIAAAGSITVEYDYEYSPEINHETAALKLAKKFGWDEDRWVGGGTAKGTGYVFVRLDKKEG